jgi:vancomycin resistance protein YoaR
MGSWEMGRVRRGGLWLVAIVIAAAFGTVGAWVVDARRHSGRTMGNLTLAGQSIGGLDRAHLLQATDQIADRMEQAIVTIRAGGADVSTSAAELGLDVDAAATAKSAFDVGRTGNPLRLLAGWLSSLRADRRAPVRLTVSTSKAFAAVTAADAATGTSPVEPSIGVKDGRVVALGGAPGKGVDPRLVLRALPAAATKASRPNAVRVVTARGTVQPRFSLASAEAVAARVESATAKPLPVVAGATKASVPTASLRAWARALPGASALEPILDPTEAAAGLDKLLPGTGQPVVQTTFTLSDGKPVVVPGKDGTGCCGPKAVAALQAAVFGGTATGATAAAAVVLPLEVVHPDVSAAEAATLGINEVVGTFTTHHAAGQPRVTNIHLIADLARGAIIKPGGTFSVNGYIGRRTAARGFVKAPVIADSVESEDIGGGVSQFATTTFNAAFFSGLDFGEYQAHTLYISRYPYGREATMGFPHPDLQIKNTTPYGVMIWTSYTATSLTITMYSTHFVDSSQSGQTKSAAGPCTRVKTERTRRYVDGATKVDYVYATYQPREGVNCFR